MNGKDDSHDGNDKTVSTNEIETKENLQEQIVAGLKKLSQKLEDDFRVDIVRKFIVDPKFAISHSWDPPWDGSGHIKAVYGDDGHKVGDYATTGNFLALYSGNTHATHVPGYGLHHETYEEYYKDEAEQKARATIYGLIVSSGVGALLKLAKEIPVLDKYAKLFEKKQPDESEKYDMASEIACFHGFDDLASDFAEALVEKLSREPFETVYNKFAPTVLGTLETERTRKEFEEAFRKAKIEMLLSKLEQPSRKWREEKRIRKIEAGDFAAFERFLSQNGITAEEKRLLADVSPIPLSNKVILMLKEGKPQSTAGNARHEET